MNKKKYHKYTKEQHDFLKKECVGITRDELTKLFNERFETNLSVSKIAAICSKNGYKSGLNTKFKDKEEPHNKKEIGSTVIKQGYKWVKVKDTGASDKDWKLLHHILWEWHYGEIKENESIIFLDQDKTNITIGNLKRVDRVTQLSFSSNKLRSEDKEINKLLLKVIEIDRLTK